MFFACCFSMRFDSRRNLWLPCPFTVLLLLAANALFEQIPHQPIPPGMSYFTNVRGNGRVASRGDSRWDYDANTGFNGLNPGFADRGGHPTQELGIELDIQLEKLANLQTERVIATRNRPCGRYGRSEFQHLPRTDSR